MVESRFRVIRSSCSGVRVSLSSCGMCVGEGRRWSVQTTGGRICSGLYIGLLGISSEGVSGAGDTPSGFPSFRDSAKEDKGESGEYLWVVMGVLRFGVRGDTGTREAHPLLTVLWDSGTGFIGKRGLINEEFLGRAEDLPAFI